MYTNLAGIFQFYNNQIANLSGQLVNLYRPPGGFTVNQTPVLTQANVRLKYEVSGIRFASPKLSNIEYYSIFGDRYLFQPGDIINSVEPGSTTPNVTVIEMSPLEECMGIRTNYNGDLIFSYNTSNQEVPLYTNIAYQWLAPAQALSSESGALLNGTQNHQDRRIALYTLPGIQPENAIDMNGNTYDVTGLRLIEYGTVPVRWMVKLVIQADNITQLVLEQEDGL